MSISVRRLRVARSARYFEIVEGVATETWVALHGYGQLAEDFIGRFEPVAGGRRIVAPEALSRFYTRSADSVGASWMTREDRLSEIADYVAFLDHVVDDLDLASGELTVLGFSQGGHTACRWVSTRSDVSRLIVWGSRIPSDLDLTAFSRSLQMGIVILVAGQDDRYVERDDLCADLETLRSIGVRAELMEYDGGHDLQAETLISVAGYPSS